MGRQGTAGALPLEVASLLVCRSPLVEVETARDKFLTTGKQPLVLSTGERKLAGGLASKGKETARILGGTMKEIEVTAGSTATLAWGSPITAEFTYSLAGNKLTVPTTVKYFGKAGEEYADWLPDNKSPKFLVYESGKKRPVLSGRFGSC